MTTVLKNFKIIFINHGYNFKPKVIITNSGFDDVVTRD